MLEIAARERALDITPQGCAWLDDRTVADLDLARVFAAIDRTSTPTGAQALWRWLTAPATDVGVVLERERRLAVLAAPAVRARIRATLTKDSGIIGIDGTLLPRLLWEPPAPLLHKAPFVALAGVVVAALVASLWWTPALIIALVVFVVNVLVDDWANLRRAQQASALEALGRLLASSARLADRLPEALGAALRHEITPLAKLRKRIGVLSVRDPFELSSALRAGFMIRLVTLARCLGLLERHRERLRRVVLWVGELDALAAIAALRAERSDACIPELEGTAIECAVVHPAIPDAIGNTVTIAQAAIVTGSNTSGKSTFLRTVAVNAILAQSIHTTFGGWRAPLLRVRAAMRITDAVDGQSTYAAEVAAIGALIAAAERGPRSLFVIDEPFRGTNPAIRVSIVVAVLDYLAARGFVIAATHDLDVAARLDACFARHYFSDTLDRILYEGISPSHNAIELLVRAGYPDAIVRRVQALAAEA